LKCVDVEMLTIENSSSMAMTTSTASRESKPRSEVKEEVAETCSSKANSIASSVNATYGAAFESARIGRIGKTTE
jgi:type IV secretory pathway TraG/TraD family ATPase VirD4